MKKIVSATAIELERIRSFCEELLADRFRLVLTQAAHEIDQLKACLIQYCKNKNLLFVSVSLSTLNQLEELLDEWILNPGQAVPSRIPGPLSILFEQGGVLFINYEASSSRVIEKLNSLFDKTARYNGKLINPQTTLTIVGAVTEKSLPKRIGSGPVLSRFRKERPISPPKVESPSQLFARKEPENISKDYWVVDLAGGYLWKEKLLGHISRNESGALVFNPGVIERALGSTKGSVKIMIRNANWDDPEFRDWFDKFVIERKEITWVKGPDYSADELADSMSNKRVRVCSRSEANPFLALNTINFDSFFLLPKADKFHQLQAWPGLIQQLSGTDIIIRVTSSLTPAQWHRLLGHDIPLTIEIDPDVALPNGYPINLSQENAAVALWTAPKPMDLNRLPQISIIQSSDLDVTTYRIAKQFPDVIVYDVTRGSNVSQLFSGFEHTEDHGFHHYESKQRQILRELQAGKTVLLKNTNLEPDLLAELELLLNIKPPTVWVNGEPQSITGSLILLEHTQALHPILSKHQNIYEDTISDQKAAYLDILQPRYSVLTDEMLNKIFAFHQELSKLPKPEIQGLYPYPAIISLGQIQSICLMKSADYSWYHAIKMVLLAPYKDDKSTYDSLRDKLKTQFPMRKAPKPEEIDKRWNRQIQMCVDALHQCPAIFIQGSTGVGKSMAATEILPSRMCINDRAAEVFDPMNVGPDTQQEDMSEVLKRWAQSETDQYHILVINEANLGSKGLWEFLQGLYEHPPKIWIGHEVYQLTEKHKIIFTGNQGRLPGRINHPLVQEQMITIFFKDFTPAYLKERIIRPLLDISDHALIDMMVQYSAQIKTLHPNHVFSPRDYQAVVNRFNRLKTVYPEKDRKQLMLDVMAQIQTEILDMAEKQALDFWSTICFGMAPDRSIQPETQALCEHLCKKDSSLCPNAATQAYVQLLREALLDREAQLKSKAFSGKSGLLVEGPSARGKDFVLKLALDQLNLKYYDFTVGVDVENMISIINKAKKEGAIVILPEMNALPSRILEGILNAVLTGEAVPGFFCFCTINPSYFESKERLSSALLNRFNLIKLPEYSPKELTQIVQKRATIPNRQLDRIIAYHLTIKDRLSQNLKAPQPTLRELLWVIDDLRLANHKPLPELIFDQYYVYNNLFLTAPLSFESDDYPSKVTEEDTVPYAAKHIIELAIPDRAIQFQISPDCPPMGHYDAGTQTITIRYPADTHSVETQLLQQIDTAKFSPPLPGSAGAPAARTSAVKTKAPASSGLLDETTIPDRIIGHTSDLTTQYFPTQVGYKTDDRGVPLMEPLSAYDLGNERYCDRKSQTITLDHPPIIKREGRFSVVDLPLRLKHYPKNIQIQGSGIRSCQIILDDDGRLRLEVKSKLFRKCRINRLIYDEYGPSDPKPTPEEIEAVHSKKCPSRTAIKYSTGPEGKPSIKPLIKKIRDSNLQSPSEIISAIEEIKWWFNENITYSKSEQTRKFWEEVYYSGANVVNALLESRAGVCFECANAMKKIVEKLFPDLPVRVSDGPVGQNGNIRKIAGHRWVEVFFDDIGWVSFDPTGFNCDDETRELLKKEKDSILDFLDEKKQEVAQHRLKDSPPPFRAVQVKKPSVPAQAEKPPQSIKESFPFLKYISLPDFQGKLRKLIPLRYPELFFQSVIQEDCTYTYDNGGQLDPARLVRGLPPFGRRKGGITFEPQTLIITDYPENEAPYRSLSGKTKITNKLKKELYFWEQLMALGFTIKIWTKWGPVSINSIEELAGTLKHASPPTAEMQRHYLTSEQSDAHTKFLTRDDMVALRDKIKKEFKKPEAKFDAKFKCQYKFLNKNEFLTKALTASDGTACFETIHRRIFVVNPIGELNRIENNWGEYSTSIGPDGTVYYRSDNTLIAFDSNGKKKWQRSFSSSLYPRTFDRGCVIGNDGTIYVKTLETAFALNPKDGSIKWQWKSPKPGASLLYFDIGPDGAVYIIDGHNCLYAFNNMESRTAHPTWTLKLPQLFLGRKPLFIGSDGTIYGVFQNMVRSTVVVAINPEGKIKWTVPFRGTWEPFIARSNGMIYFSSFDHDYRKSIYILDSNGNKRLWSPRPHAKLSWWSHDVDVNGTIYVVSGSQKVTAFNPDNTVRWHLRTKSKITGPVLTGSDGRIFVSCEDGVEVYE